MAWKAFVRVTGLFYTVLLFYIFFLARRRPHPTLFKDKMPWNIIPLQYKINYFLSRFTLSVVETRNFYVNLFGNIILFIPMPLFLEAFFNITSARKQMLLTLLISMSVECIQFVLSVGVADIDDVLLNCLGAGIGILAIRYLKNTTAKEYLSF